MSFRTRALALSLALLAQLVFGITPLLAQEGGRATTADREPGQTAKDEGGVEVITVTARRKEENIQDIPIAVSAFSADDLATSNIDDVADVQFNVPNLTFTKTNFSGAGNIAIRGVGNLAVAATAENGTGIHINDAPFPGSRIYETEFYDVGSVQVLRGPQGTLFGRSSPGGAVNVYTKKPVMEEWGGYGALEYGEYNHVKARAALNVPIGEHLAARAAAFYFRRDGITDVKNGKYGCVGKNPGCPKDDEIDGRNVYAFRASLHGEWDDANFDLMGQYFRADDDRMRINNQGCTSDNTAWPNGIGCLGGNNKTQPGGINYNSTLGYSSGIYIDTLTAIGAAPSRFLSGPQAIMTPLLFTNALAPPGGLPAPLVNAMFGYFTAPGNQCVMTPSAANPNAGTCPGYLLQGTAGDALGDAIFGAGTYGMPTEFYAGTNRPKDLRTINTQMNPRYKADEIQITFTANFDLTENLSLTSVTGWHRAWVNSMTDYWWGTPDNGFGANRTYDFPNSNLGGQYGSEFVFDKSKQTDTMFTEELRVVSSFDGIFNFQAGAIYNDAKVYAIYDVWATSLESFWKAVGAYPFQPDTSFYKNETRPSTLQSYAIFGETYFDLTEKTRLTVGARYTDDKKTSTQRVNLWTIPKDPYTTQEGGWTQVIWKVSLDQHFDLPWAPDSLGYFTVSTGYKGGGFNPAVSASQSGGTASQVPPEFKPETITAYELGYKGTWFDQLQLGLTGFYYNYADMQIGKIVNRTAVNENLDSKIWGVELESVWAPSFLESLRLDMNVSWLQSEIQKGSSIDGADPAQGRAGWMPIKQLLPFPAGQNSVCNPALNPYCLDPFYARSVDAADPTNLLPDLTPLLPAGACRTAPIGTMAGNLADLIAANPDVCGYVNDGFAANLKGKKLPQAPEWTLKIGAQYSLPDIAGWVATPRIDFYWHSEMFARVYNTRKDAIDGWQQLDANLAITKEGSSWMFEIWAKNLQDNNDITGHYFTDPTSANFTNLFLLEPRTVGATVRYTFGASEY